MAQVDLKKIGLSESESLVYNSVLVIGKCNVGQIAKHSGMHRTNIYDILEQLKEKGLITFGKEGRSTAYQVSDPRELYSFIDERKRYLDDAFPRIMELAKQSREDVAVEVYKGKEGMKAAFSDMLRKKKDIYRIGAEGLLRKNFPEFGEHWLSTLKKQGQKYTGIYTKRDIEPSHYTEIRYLPPDYRNPSSVIIYGDNVNINIWEPTFISIVIRSKIVAHMYMQHFNMLWRIAKK